MQSFMVGRHLPLPCLPEQLILTIDGRWYRGLKICNAGADQLTVKVQDNEARAHYVDHSTVLLTGAGHSTVR